MTEAGGHADSKIVGAAAEGRGRGCRLLGAGADVTGPGLATRIRVSRALAGYCWRSRVGDGVGEICPVGGGGADSRSIRELGRMAVTGVGVSSNSEIVPGDVPGGPSTSQTIMVSSLQRLLAELPPDAPPASYRIAVMEENVLGKQTVSGREWAFRQLRRFYALNPQSLLFRALRDLWEHGKAGQPLLALLCALARDPVLRASAAVIVSNRAR